MAAKSPPDIPVLYETDCLRWADATLDALRRRAVAELDWEHLIEEVEGLSISWKRALRSQTVRLLKHLIKCEIQPGKRTDSWETTISNARTDIDSWLELAPSMRHVIAASLDKWYEAAYRDALRETGVRPGTEYTKWSLDQILDHGFLP